MASLGSDLKAAREAKGISLEEMAAATRINLRFLKALEDDDLSAFRSDFFARSVIRAFVQAVGLDERDALARYEPKARRSAVQPSSDASARRTPAIKSLPSPLKNAVFFLFSAAAVALTLFVFLRNRAARPEAPAAEPQAAVASAPAVQAPESPVEASAPPAAAPIPLPAEVRGVRLELAFTAETWIQAYADGAVKLDGLQPAGATARLEAESEIVLHLGNAGGVTGALNGRRLKPFGASGAVVKNISLTPANLADFWE